MYKLISKMTIEVDKSKYDILTYPCQRMIELCEGKAEAE